MALLLLLLLPCKLTLKLLPRAVVQELLLGVVRQVSATAQQQRRFRGLLLLSSKPHHLTR